MGRPRPRLCRQHWTITANILYCAKQQYSNVCNEDQARCVRVYDPDTLELPCAGDEGAEQHLRASRGTVYAAQPGDERGQQRRVAR